MFFYGKNIMMFLQILHYHYKPLRLSSIKYQSNFVIILSGDTASLLQRSLPNARDLRANKFRVVQSTLFIILKFTINQFNKKVIWNS